METSCVGVRRFENLKKILVLRGYSEEQLSFICDSNIADLVKTNNKKALDFVSDFLGFNVIEYVAFMSV